MQPIPVYSPAQCPQRHELPLLHRAQQCPHRLFSEQGHHSHHRLSCPPCDGDPAFEEQSNQTPVDQQLERAARPNTEDRGSIDTITGVLKQLIARNIHFKSVSEEHAVQCCLPSKTSTPSRIALTEGLRKAVRRSKKPWLQAHCCGAVPVGAVLMHLHSLTVAVVPLLDQPTFVLPKPVQQHNQLPQQCTLHSSAVVTSFIPFLYCLAGTCRAQIAIGRTCIVCATVSTSRLSQPN
eukprot:GHRR01029196.1.p1 GENE.GHRR01029196.1~~GHRR01029196.1.p1  ORF type:complete len:236 (+),score=20.10 GHRR01029196.1:118-825(+)